MFVKTTMWLVLASRLVLFLFFQALIALVLKSWHQSEKYWLLSASLTNGVSIFLLFYLFKREGKQYLTIFKPNKTSLKKDFLVFSGIVLVALPLIFLPGYFLAEMIWGDPDFPTRLMFGPIEKWLLFPLMVVFPVTIGMAELATYFRYIMKKLREQFKTKWLSMILPVLFLSVQHCTLPFIPDFNFIMYRALVFLPFAVLIGISIYLRPSLFIYFVVFHALLDFGTVLMFFGGS